MKVNLELVFEPLDMSKVENKETYWCIYQNLYEDVQHIDILTYIEGNWYMGYNAEEGLRLFDEQIVIYICNWNEIVLKDGVIVK